MEGCWILYTSIGGPYWCNYFCLCCQTKRYQWEIVSPQLFVFKHYALFSAAIIIYLGHHAPHTHITCVSYSFFWLIFLVDIPSIKLLCNAETRWLPKSLPAWQSVLKYSLNCSCISTFLCFIAFPCSIYVYFILYHLFSLVVPSGADQIVATASKDRTLRLWKVTWSVCTTDNSLLICDLPLISICLA